MENPDQLSAAIRKVQAIRISTVDLAAAPVAEKVDVALEVPLVVDVEGIERYTLMCTPIDRRALALGFLFSEGVIDSMADVALIEVCPTDPNVVRVELADGLQRIGDPGRNLVIVSSCGACGTEEFSEKLDSLPEVGDTLRINSGVLQSAGNDAFECQSLFNACGGTHAAMLIDSAGRIIAFAEDGGRHHALDKVIGKCLMEGLSSAGCGVVLSGRVSLEIVGKCARAGIELISAISAPTSLAVDVAGHCNITLCAFVRENRATVFTHPIRIKEIQKQKDNSL
ncbi:formate dehydrogenase accessory sulfurtransferase FdhD [Planctomycetota bacterium]